MNAIVKIIASTPTAILVAVGAIGLVFFDMPKAWVPLVLGVILQFVFLTR